MAKPKTHTARLELHVSPDLLAALRKSADHYGVPVATYVREMLVAARTLSLATPVFNEQATKEELLWFIDSNRDPRPCPR